MYTIQGIQEILDREGYATLDGYNAIRTDLLGVLTPSLTEYEELLRKVADLETENKRIKEANVALYNKVEKQITGGAPGNDLDGDGDEGDGEQAVSDVVDLYTAII